MKKLLLTLLCIFSLFAAKAQCDYTFEATDSWGDGWNGASMDVLLNGGVILDDATANDNGGGNITSTDLFPFPVTIGDDITTIWNADGDFPGEISWRILDADGVAVFSGIAGDAVVTGDIPLAVCPSCIPPSAFALTVDSATDATVTFTDPNVPTADNYEYELVDVTAGDPVTGVTINVITPSISLTALTVGNNYQIILYTECGSLVSSPSATVTFDFNFTPVPDCVTDTLPASGSTGVSTGASFSWVAAVTGTPATSFDFYLTAANDAAGTLNNIGNVLTSPVNITGLDLSAEYGWAVVPVNAGGANDVCLSTVNTFTVKDPPTPPTGVTCVSGDASIIVYSEELDTQGAWTGDFNAGNGTWIFGATTSSGAAGPTSGPQSGAAFMYYEASVTLTIPSAAAVSPAIDLTFLTPGDAVELSFFLHAFGPGSGELTVGVGTDVAGPFTNEFTWDGALQGAQADGFLPIGVDLTAYNGQTIFLEIRNTGNVNGNFIGDTSIDLIEITACTDACLPPTALAASNFNVGVADFDWADNAGSVSYDYEVQDVGVAQGDAGAIVASTNVVVSEALAVAGAFVDGNDYTLYVRTNCAADSSPYSSIDFTFTLPLVNDFCSGAIPITPSAEGTGCVAATFTLPFTTDGTTDSGVPTVCSNPGLDQYFTWTATSPALIFSSTNPGSPGIAVFADCADATAGTSIACANTFGTNVQLSGWALGDNLIIQVYDFQGSFSDVAFCLEEFTPPPAPANDDFANAEPLTVGTSCSNTAGTLISGTESPETPAPSCASFDGPDVWYSFTAPANGNIFADLSTGASGSPFDTGMSLYSFDALGGTLTEVQCNDDGANGTFSSVVVTDGSLTPGATYYLRVWSFTASFASDFAICAYSPDCPGDVKIWTGTEWQVGGVTDVAPISNDTAIIDGTYDSGTDGNIDACSLVVTFGTTLNIDAASYASILGDITVSGTLNVLHTGSVVQVSNTAVTANGGTINVNVTTPLVGPRSFMLIGSPMSTADRADFAGFKMMNHDTNAFDMFVDPMLADATNFVDSDNNDWTDFTGTLNPGEGYIYWPGADILASGSYNLVYDNGTLNNGDIFYPTIFGTDKNDSPNMLSNPYPSAINTDLLIGLNPAIDEVYFWEHNTTPDPSFPGANTANFNMEDISIRNSGAGVASTTGGTAPGQFMSTAQGFAIKAADATPVAFSNGMRSTGNNDDLRNPLTADRLWLNVTSNAYGLASNLAIVFTDQATAGFEASFDTQRLATIVSMYTQIEGSDNGYTIQGREVFTNGATVTSGFSSLVDENTEYTVSMTDREGGAMEEASIYLIDNALNTITDLTITNYTFESVKGNFPGRFTIVFENAALGTNDFDVTSISMYPNPAANVVTIASPNAAISLVEVRDIRGRVVLTNVVSDQNVATINVTTLDSAIYLVTITTDSGSITSRLLKE
jgi:hypothetical protein